MNIYDDYAKKDIDIKNIRIRIKDLEQENKKLSEKIGQLEEENKRLKEYKSQRTRKIERENRKLKEELGVWLNANKILRMHDAKMEYDNKKLKEENELLKQCLDKLMFDSDIVNVQIHGELGDYCYVRSDKKFKLNVKD